MFECIMTVKGDGKGQYGRSKADRTGPVSMFMVGNTTLYPVVKAHILNCPACDPTEALKVYLQRRMSKHGGAVTGDLARVALSYERMSERKIPKDLVDEFLWRCNDIQTITIHERRLSCKQMALCLKNVRLHWNGKKPTSVTMTPRMEKIWRIIDAGALPEDEEELDKLMAVADVTLL